MILHEFGSTSVKIVFEYKEKEKSFISTSHKLQTINIDFNVLKDLEEYARKNLSLTTFSLSDFLKDKKYSRIVSAYASQNNDEILLYRIEKNGQLLTFLNGATLLFLDDEVSYDTQYFYNIYEYRLIGSKIKVSKIDSFNGRIIDYPPVKPEVDIIPYVSLNKIKVNLNAGLGEYKALPVTLLDSDEIYVEKLRSQGKVEVDGTIIHKYQGDTKKYQVFRLDFKPTSYDDFKENLYKEIESVNSSCSFDDIFEGKRYYTFRAVDKNGSISNPTDIYEVEIINDNGTIYTIIKILNKDDLLKNEFYIDSKKFKKLLQIVPAYRQVYTEDEKSKVIGTSSPSVWGRQFKFRLTSNKTGKIIDLFVTFKQVTN